MLLGRSNDFMHRLPVHLQIVCNRFCVQIDRRFVSWEGTNHWEEKGRIWSRLLRMYSSVCYHTLLHVAIQCI